MEKACQGTYQQAIFRKSENLSYNDWNHIWKQKEVTQLDNL